MNFNSNGEPMQLSKYLLLVICCLNHLSANDKTQHPKESATKTVQTKQAPFNEQEMAAIDETLKQQLGNTDSFAQSLYENLANQPLAYAEALKTIEEMREVLQHFLYTKPSSIEDRITRSQIMSAMCQHLYIGVCSNFNNWKQFNVPTKRTASGTTSKKDCLTQLENSITATAAHISKTNQEMPYLGLSTMRKSLRKSAEFMYKYSPPKAYTLGAAGITAIALWYIYSLDQETSVKPIENNFIRNLLIKIKQFTGNRGIQRINSETGMTTLSGRSDDGVIKKLEDMVNAAGISFHEAVPMNMYKQIISAFALGQAGTYLADKCKDQYNKFQGYIFGTTNGQPGANIKNVQNGFSDIIGNDVAKNTLEPFIEYIIDPKKFNINGSKPGNAILLTGETRTGKTHLAERFVGEINTRLKQRGESPKVQLIEIKAGISGYLEATCGSVCNGIRILMEHHAPCVIFIDEIHLLGLNQEKDPKMLSDFLTLLSGTEKSHQDHPSLIIAATNHPEQLDKALRQKGRFGTEIVLTYPQAEERASFIMRKLKQSGIKADKNFVLSFIHKTQGLAFEQIEELIRHQKQNAIINSEPITAESLDAAFNKVIYNIEEESDQLSDNDAMLTAIGVSAQILTHDLLQKSKPSSASMVQQPKRIIDRATILPINRRIKMQEEQGLELKTIRCQGGIFTFLLDEQSSLLNETDLRNQVMVKLASSIGQELVLNTRALHTHDFNPDLYEAYQLCLKIVSRGLKLELLSKERQHALKEDAYKLMGELESRVKDILKDKAQQINLIAGILLMQRTLNQIEIAFLLEKPENAQAYIKEILGSHVDFDAIQKESTETATHAEQKEQLDQAVQAA